VLLALAEAAESNPNRVGELLAEVRRRAPRWIEGLREAVLLASSSIGRSDTGARAPREV